MFGNGLLDCLMVSDHLSAFSNLVLHKLVLAELFGHYSHSYENLFILMNYIYRENFEERYACFYPWIHSLPVTQDFLQAITVVPTGAMEIAKDILSYAKNQGRYDEEMEAFLQLYKNHRFEEFPPQETLIDSQITLDNRKEVNQQNFHLIQRLLRQL
jgi:hypothetical protein